jgi:nucleoside-triphosphatase THEP1
MSQSANPSSPARPAAITALMFANGTTADGLIERIVRHLQTMDVACAGFIQRERPRANRSRCDMLLENLTSGALVDITEDRGPDARGCRLDSSALSTTVARTRADLDGADVLVINRFGKSESEGGGFRSLIGDAIEHGVPVLIAVPWRNIEAWRQFSGGLSTDIDAATLTGDGAALCAVLGFSAVAEPALEGGQRATDPA